MINETFKMFKMWRALYVLAALMVLAGCTNPLLTGDASIEARVQETIANAEVGLTIAYRAVSQEAKAGVLTKAELTEALVKLDRVAVGLTKAQSLRRNGLFAESLNEALTSDKLLKGVQALLAERIKKQRAGGGG